ncbi:hypothetical protein LMH87_001149 [Akanthomyces muscarius]|uniref:Uncharacterized protein n=1 Tax=Akanthomyces muscarius TaxID=2231603 RepID=A0A9W8QI93_AKAMU|nr:hypothetical protein LMH87_001149 [Akanthomyces muscarius]KAJ4155927.1 hypothetical protein LMH87_001149 [Akanthomyces muscarius]
MVAATNIFLGESLHTPADQHMLTSLLGSDLEGIDDGKRDRLATTPRPPKSALSSPRGRRGVSHTYCLILTNKGLTALQSRCTPTTATDPISAKTPGSSKGLAAEQPPDPKPGFSLPRAPAWILRTTKSLASHQSPHSRPSPPIHNLLSGFSQWPGPTNYRPIQRPDPLPMVWLLPISSSHNSWLLPISSSHNRLASSNSQQPSEPPGPIIQRVASSKAWPSKASPNES